MNTLNTDILKCVAFDLDGTIYFGSRQLAPRAQEVIDFARKKFGRVCFVTNNSALTRYQVYQRLCQLGVSVNEDEVLNSSYLISRYLISNRINHVWCIGTENLCQELKVNGIDPKSECPDAIVIGYDYNFALPYIEEALKVYTPKCQIVVANTERVYPRDNGILTPGAGAIASAFMHTVNRTDIVILGKPNILMLDTVAKLYDISANEILMVGDTYESDIQMAETYGSQSVLIKNNDTKDYPCNTVNALQDLLDIL